MIIQIRGTSGSGKSTLVRKIMERYPVRNPHLVEGRKKPLLYVCHASAGLVEPLFVIGHYEGEINGGCDTIKNMDLVYQTVAECSWKGYVLFEGKTFSDGARRILELERRLTADLIRVILLSTSPSQCVLDTAARGAGTSLETIQQLHDKCLRDSMKMQRAGVSVEYLDRDAALVRVLGYLGLNQ